MTGGPMSAGLTFTPMIPWPLIAAGVAIAFCLLLVSLRRGGRGTIFRALAVLMLATALANPRLSSEIREARPDLALVVVDRSPSQTVAQRVATTDAATAAVLEALEAHDDLEVRTVEVNADANGTRLVDAVNQALAEDATGRLAGAMAITDGQAHDGGDPLPAIGDAPFHVLLTGSPSERDRRLTVERAPAYGLVGQPVTVEFRIDDHHAGDTAGAQVRVRADGTEVGTIAARVGEPQSFDFTLRHAGATALELEVDAVPGELSAVNNRAAVTISGVRDRMRVLLVSGQPHPGERTWRNLLKSDPAVDLIHFTILRPPEKDDMTPLGELSLIVFPVQELFDEKLHEFDLVVFGRYVVRNVLPMAYMRNVVAHLRQGGAVLLATGPEFASLASLYRTPLGDVMPGAPTGRVREGAFRPTVTDLGRRHPVTSALPGAEVSGDADEEAAGRPTWGRWHRLVEVEPRRGSTLMTGLDGQPLLMVDRIGEGRIALMSSDQIWLWARGYEGGGPHDELIRRLAHWLMKEPDLEEERLIAQAEGDRLVVERRSLGTEPVEATVTGPLSATRTVRLDPGDDGVARAEVPAATPGLYRVDDGARTALAAVGPPNPAEYADLRATPERLRAAVEASGGGIAWVADGLPDIRRTQPGRDAVGRGWIGLRRTDAFRVTGVTETSLLSGLLLVTLALGTLMIAWWREGR